MANEKRNKKTPLTRRTLKRVFARRKRDASKAACCHEDSESPDPINVSVVQTPSNTESSSLQNVRLSLAGIACEEEQPESDLSQDSDELEDPLDELHSNLYSTVVDRMRAKLKEAVPQLSEDMISQAIIEGFASGHLHGIGSVSSLDGRDLSQVEVEHFASAHNWMQQQREECSEAKKVNFLRGSLGKMFCEIRNEELNSPDQAVGILINVCAILGLPIDKSVQARQDTVVLEGLDVCTTTREDLTKALSRYGRIKSVALSSGQSGFAHCRFQEESAVSQLMLDRALVQIAGVRPSVSVLGSGLFPEKTPVELLKAPIDDARSPTSVVRQLFIVSSKGHDSKIPSSVREPGVAGPEDWDYAALQSTEHNSAGSPALNSF